MDYSGRVSSYRIIIRIVSIKLLCRDFNAWTSLGSVRGEDVEVEPVLAHKAQPTWT